MGSRASCNTGIMADQGTGELHRTRYQRLSLTEREEPSRDPDALVHIAPSIPPEFGSPKSGLGEKDATVSFQSSGLFHEQLIHIAPSPAFPWFNTANDGMPGRVKMLRGMSIL